MLVSLLSDITAVTNNCPPLPHITPHLTRALHAAQAARRAALPLDVLRVRARCSARAEDAHAAQRSLCSQAQPLSGARLPPCSRRRPLRRRWPPSAPYKTPTRPPLSAQPPRRGSRCVYPPPRGACRWAQKPRANWAGRLAPALCSPPVTCVARTARVQTTLPRGARWYPPECLQFGGDACGEGSAPFRQRKHFVCRAARV